MSSDSALSDEKKRVEPLGVDHDAHRRALLVRTHWLRWFIGISAMFIVAVIFVVFAYGRIAAQHMFIGWTICFIMNLVSGWLTFGSIGRSMNRVMIIAFSGLLLRMAIVGVSVAIAVIVYEMSPMFFITGLMGGYVLYQALEIFMLKSVVRVASGAAE